jgi:hypothetical protein
MTAEVNTSREVTLTFTVPDKLLTDIIITGCEGGIGYWSQLESYDYKAVEEGEPLRAREQDDFTTGEWMTLDRDAVARGVKVLLQDYSESVAARNITKAITGFESGDYDYDAGDADCVIQCGLLGEIRYG